MKTRLILILSLLFLIGAPDISSQSFKDRLKNATEKVSKKVAKEVTKKTLKKNEKVTARTAKIRNKGKNNAQTSTTVAPLPSNHAALFAPVGDPVDATWGVKSAKVTRPPKDEAKQPDWNDARPSVYELDNKSLVDEFVLLNECIESKYIDFNSPCGIRFNSVQRELTDRIDIIDDMVSNYDDGPEYLAIILGRRQYHVVVRSSLAPLFEQNINGETWFRDATRNYFEAHGGYKNAHKNLTKWDPNGSSSYGDIPDAPEK